MFCLFCAVPARATVMGLAIYPLGLKVVLNDVQQTWVRPVIWRDVRTMSGIRVAQGVMSQHPPPLVMVIDRRSPAPASGNKAA